MTGRADYLETAVDRALSRLGHRLVMGLPLGLGKPNRLVNAFYRRAKEDPSVELEIVTALSLDPPSASSDLERRFLGPFVDRHFGADYPRLDYVADLEGPGLPPNVRLVEFYSQPGAGLGVPAVQQNHVSSNYTHVVRDLLDRGVNLVLQLVARDEDDGGRLSLSSNPDLTLDLVRSLGPEGRERLFLVGQVHPELPFMHGDALVEEGFFDLVVQPDPEPHRLFALPRTPVGTQDHWVGLHASTLVADGGSLQIGIGALSDALVHALVFRHRENEAYRQVLVEGPQGAAPFTMDGPDPFHQGLYGASEMFMDGFMHLYQAGILRREVFDDLEVQRRSDEGRLGEGDPEPGTGSVMDAAFFLGSEPFYRFLRELEPHERPRFRMDAVSRINQLYGGSEALEVAQRRRARFFNTCMMVTATGAAVSDGLADHQVVSGVGGQYNFVAMAHAMTDGRSVLMLRSTRESGGGTVSNIVWEYPHTTIPRHLRDLVVTEYGVAELRGRTDQECIQAMVGITDARFQDELVGRAREAGKLDPAWEVPARARGNTPGRLEEALAPHRDQKQFSDFPFGSDFTDVELRLVAALRRLKGWSRSRLKLARAATRGRPGTFPEELERMGLGEPQGLRERLQARLVAAALAES